MNTKEAIREAIRRAGSQRALADMINCSQPTVFRMLTGGKVSAQYVLEIERKTGVSRHQLAPDIYPPEAA